MLKKILCAAIVLSGAAWPFLAHGFAMKKLFMTLGTDPRLWLLYSLFVVVLPTPAILFAGFMLFLRDEIPFPGNATVSGLAAAAVMLVVSIVFWISVGSIGFRVPL
jgi:hypothetical protein